MTKETDHITALLDLVSLDDKQGAVAYVQSMSQADTQITLLRMTAMARKLAEKLVLLQDDEDEQ